MTKREYMIEIADSAIAPLSTLTIENEDDRAHAAEVVRQTASRAVANRREGWTQDDYSTLRTIVHGSASIKVGLTKLPA